MSIEQFYTREASNNGKKVMLETPDGEKSNEWIVIRSTHADEYRKQRSITASTMVERLTDDPVKNAELEEEEKLKVLASLVADWSFEPECNTENKIAFLREAPQIADFVNTYSTKIGEFVEKKHKRSKSTQKKS